MEQVEMVLPRTMVIEMKATKAATVMPEVRMANRTPMEIRQVEEVV